MNNNDLEFIEPVLRGLNCNLRWFQEEYSTNEIKNYKFQKSDSIEYYYIGSRIFDIDNKNLHHSHNKLFYNDIFVDKENDGVVCLDEAVDGEKVVNLLSNHYNLVGLDGTIDDKVVNVYVKHLNEIEKNYI